MTLIFYVVHVCRRSTLLSAMSFALTSTLGLVLGRDLQAAPRLRPPFRLVSALPPDLGLVSRARDSETIMKFHECPFVFS
jgi:hypothetical protein